MEEHVCGGCGFVYDEQEKTTKVSAPPQAKFPDLPQDWVCPVCGAGKELFIEVTLDETADTPD